MKRDWLGTLTLKTKATKANKKKPSYLFGFKSNYSDSKVSIQQVPWEVTTSYGGGTSRGPQAIFKASPQLDLFDIETGEPYQSGIYLTPPESFISKSNKPLRSLAKKVIAANEKAAAESDIGVADATQLSPAVRATLKKVNAGCQKMVELVYSETKSVLADNKIPGLLGGDHSTPLGAIQAVCEQWPGEVGILHIDAHADLRVAYQGFQHSHASIMHNVMKLKNGPSKIVQVGIRDFCREEYDYIQSDARITTNFDRDLKAKLDSGDSWLKICNDIANNLPEKIYISFDIDGLSPSFCPNTGTPVPGGLSFDQVLSLIGTIGRAKKIIVGFDLNEVAPGKDDWDGNVGARILYKLCGWAIKTNA